MHRDDSDSIETELKLMLPDAAALQRLCARLGPPEDEALQRNLYFDAADRRLARAHWALRLRLCPQRAWLTLKGESSFERGWTKRPEFEIELEPQRAKDAARDTAMLRELAVKLAADRLEAELLAAPLTLRGELTTLRRSYRRAEGRAELVLDHSHYPDGSSVYELELECRDPQLARLEESKLRQLLRSQGIGWQPSSVSKLARLLSLLASDEETERGP
jgi:uncharacterized protein YjbK